MKNLRAFLLPLCLSFFTLTGFAQSAISLQLTSRNGLGADRLYEQGASPLHYSGLALQWAGETDFQWKRCRILQSCDLSASMGFNAKSDAIAYGLTVESATAFLYLWHSGKDGDFRLWGGGSIDEYLHITYLPDLMNASFSMSDFLSLCACFTTEYDFGFRKSDGRRPFSVFGSLCLPFAGIALRPGFPYMDNYNDNPYQLNFLADTYSLHGIALSGVSTSTGIACTLSNRNRIGISYDWSYRSSGHKGVYRFDHARHLLALHLSMNLLYRTR
ncbi:MAG: hypothetical protein J5873_05195 [Bacteroidales bacterium]|nr:hypothetical protein [Bacteroidales bacterium]